MVSSYNGHYRTTVIGNNTVKSLTPVFPICTVVPYNGMFPIMLSSTTVIFNNCYRGFAVILLTL